MSKLDRKLINLLNQEDRVWIDAGSQTVRSGTSQFLVPNTGDVVSELLALGWQRVSSGYGDVTIMAKRPSSERNDAPLSANIMLPPKTRGTRQAQSRLASEPLGDTVKLDSASASTRDTPRLQIFVADNEVPNTLTRLEFTANQLVSVDEFDTWFIKSPLGKDDELYIRWADDFIQLDWSQAHGGFVWPKGTRKTARDLGSYKHAIGILRLYRRSGTGDFASLDCALFIAAASLEEHEYPLLLDRLGQLAVSDFGPVVAPVAGPLPTRLAGKGLLVDSPIVRQALALVEFFGILRTQWNVIQAAPAFAISRSTRKVRVGRKQAGYQSSAAIQQSKRPGATHVWMNHLEENHDSAENRFLAHVLRYLLLRSRIVATGVTEKAKALLTGTPSPPSNEPTAVTLWRQGRATAKEAAEYLFKLVAHLEAVDQWVQAVQKHALMAGVRPELPRNPSLRLTRSPGYSAVYGAFRQLTDRRDHYAAVDTALIGLIERRVKPIMELYEIWVFMEIYAALVEVFGFQPVGEGPFAHLEFQDGRMKLVRGQRYELELRLKDSYFGIYRVSLTYEPPDVYPACGRNKRCYVPDVCRGLRCWVDAPREDTFGPDVVMETEYLGESLKFAIDAKYRRYKIQRPSPKEMDKFGYEDQAAIDILGHAKQKYLDGKQYDAAFLVHSDPSLTFLGGEPYETTPWRELESGLPRFPRHQYGAVFAVPFKISNLEILLKCLLMYHAGWYDICWTCRTRLQPQDGTGLVGKIYQCEHGHDFWVVSHCQNRSHHRLIKMGERSFHKTKPGNEWNCVCPECGDILPPRIPLPSVVDLEDLGFIF